MTLTELGNALGISKGQVSKLADRGMPTDSVEAARAWRAKNLHPSWSEEARAAGEGAAAGAGNSSAFWAAKTRKEAAQAELAEIELAREKRALCEIEKVHRALYAAHRVLRDQLLSVPNRLAAQVVGVTPQAAAELMRGEIRRCLDEFSQLNDQALGQLVGEGEEQ
ncbi:hypothetical protein IAI53_07615 [Thauera sp. CAU 1555]|uniref:Phage DNA packaging Nu1 family protein n=1 Tax=Thauera sedimentorum TaxID=2767595 RepID=A0ABR9B937_9RHOO|nr:hypothetical protein [Thauera sedimentorum]MBC9071833.1 hypothetical protein [Thauera sedimentorum]MBD8502752.1 hypothetical protein [Thauera sedimentorum]